MSKEGPHNLAGKGESSQVLYKSSHQMHCATEVFLACHVRQAFLIRCYTWAACSYCSVDIDIGESECTR